MFRFNIWRIKNHHVAFIWRIARLRIITCWMLCIAMLSGCQSIHLSSKNYRPALESRYKHKKSDVQDSAPLGAIPKFFKLIIPRDEPLSRYGNPATYKVNGHRYNIMRTAYGYKERGLASWYATKFHSRRTSSGEHYDMYALTAAHKTLPLPTYVRVKNLDNGRVAILKVNDRGPFHPGRIIDLSYGSAVKLGVFPKGTARVEVEALNLKKAGKVSQAHVSSYFLQVGAFSSLKLAEISKRNIAKITRSPVLIVHERRQYLVRVGPIANRKTIDNLKKLLASKGITGTFSLLL